MFANRNIVQLAQQILSDAQRIREDIIRRSPRYSLQQLQRSVEQSIKRLYEQASRTLTWLEESGQENHIANQYIHEALDIIIPYLIEWAEIKISQANPPLNRNQIDSIFYSGLHQPMPLNQNPQKNTVLEESEENSNLKGGFVSYKYKSC